MKPTAVNSSLHVPYLRSVTSGSSSAKKEPVFSKCGENAVQTPLVGISPAIERIRKMVERIAGTSLPVVISGESGVGKEVVANNLYHRSARCRKPMVKVNCAALPDGLLESELFGYEPGAFTGAQKRKRGKFELSDGGVLLLDEIGDMPLSLQAKLLHALQNGEYTPLGSERQVETDVWVICLTNHDLIADMKQKRFREDLYYRISNININIPPLRERKEDIEPLVTHFVHNFAGPNAMEKMFTPGVVNRMMAHSWPGNVRELQNVVKRMLILGNPEEVLSSLSGSGSEDIGRTAPRSFEESSRFFVYHILKSCTGEGQKNGFSLKQIRAIAVNEIEKSFILKVLDKTAWNRTKAARILKISYKTLLNKIKDLDISEPDNGGS